MMKRLISMVLIFIMCLNMSACGSTGNNNTEQKEENTRIFVDDCGREVEIKKEIHSYVPSGPLAQIITFAIAPDEMVGIASKWYDSASGIIGDSYLELPYLGQLYGSADMNLEELAYVGPEVIIDIGEVKPSTESDLETLQNQTKIPTVFISSNVEDMPNTFRKLGELFGKEEKAEELAQFCEKVYERTNKVMEQVGEHKVKGMFVVGEEGLHVLAKDTFQAEIFDMLVDNIAVMPNAISKGTGTEVTMEQISIWNPDFILYGPKSVYVNVKDDVLWNKLDAVKNDSYIEVPEGPHNWMGSPPAVQQYLGLIWLTAELYPEYCDYDVKEEIMEYYRLFYHCELTDTQYEQLIKNALLK